MRTINLRALLVLIGILALSAAFRLTGINWDSNAHLHPDERFLTMVSSGISWPKSVTQYLDTNSSPANPHNKGFTFYVYGTYPLHITKYISEIVGKPGYDGFTYTGRFISALLDIVTTLLVFLIAMFISKKSMVALLASFIYAISVLPIQLSHFFAMDPFVTLWTTASLWRIVRGKFDVLLGIFIALAVGAKISAALIIVLVVLAFFLTFPWLGKSRAIWKKRIQYLLPPFFCAISFLTILRLVYPYLFVDTTINPKLLANWEQLASFEGPTTTFPPGLQWVGVAPWQPILDLVVWGLGLPLGVAAALSIIYVVVEILRKRSWNPSGLLVLWIVISLGFHATHFAKAMRYMWSIYPAIAVLTGIGLWSAIEHVTRHRLRRLAIACCMAVIFLIWPVSFMHIYTKPNTRVDAVRWIYSTIPPGSTIAWEHWDDPLPFPFESKSPSNFTQKDIQIFNPDSPEKWRMISTVLAQADYLILASNRAYGAMGRVPTRFPQTNAYYQQLFSGNLGFTPTKIFHSRPTLPFAGFGLCLTPPGFTYGILAKQIHPCASDGITYVDDYADETFTVYDHPIVTIFENTGKLSAASILSILEP